MLKTLLRAAPHTKAKTIDACFRDLYTRVLIGTGPENSAVVGVSSAIAGEGKTTTAIGLAAMLASDKVLTVPGGTPGEILLIECNQGLTSVSHEFDLLESPGLLQYLRHECSLEDTLRSTDVPHLSILPVGGPGPNFSIVIRTAAMHRMLQRLRERFAMIILDLPSVLTTTDTLVLAELADYLLLVVRSGITSSKLVRQTLEEVDPDKLMGIVLNDRRSDLPTWLESRL